MTNIQMKQNFKNWKPRASKLSQLMVKSRSKSEAVGKTAQSFLRDEYIRLVYGREKIVRTKKMQKGIEVENESISLINNTQNTFYSKNEKQFENDFVTGTPDIITDDLVIDVKSSYNLWTFHSHTFVPKEYYAQLQAYMWLSEKQKAQLIFVLVNTPQHLIYREFAKAFYSSGVEDGSVEMDKLQNDIEKNYIYDDIPQEKRIRIFDIKRDDEYIEEVQFFVKEGRKFLKKLDM